MSPRVLHQSCWPVAAKVIPYLLIPLGSPASKGWSCDPVCYSHCWFVQVAPCYLFFYMVITVVTFPEGGEGTPERVRNALLFHIRAGGKDLASYGHFPRFLGHKATWWQGQPQPNMGFAWMWEGKWPPGPAGAGAAACQHCAGWALVLAGRNASLKAFSE